MSNLLLSLVPGRSILYVIVAAALAGLVAWHWTHEAAVRQAAVDAAVAGADARWRAALAKEEAEARITLNALQAATDQAGDEARTSRQKIEALQRQIETDNAALPKNDAECLDAGRARLLDRL